MLLGSEGRAFGGEARAVVLGGEAREVSGGLVARAGGEEEGPREGGREGERAHGVGLERLGDEGEPEREGEGMVSSVGEVEPQTGRDPPGGAVVACSGEMTPADLVGTVTVAKACVPEKLLEITTSCILIAFLSSRSRPKCHISKLPIPCTKILTEMVTPM